MHRLGLTLTLILLAAALAGCGTGIRAHLPAFLGGQPAQAAGTRIQGTVQSVNGNTVTLQDGSSFTLDTSTRIAHPVTATLADIAAGNVVAVTATKQADNSLLASIVNIFPASQQIPMGQRPLTGGNLMTNATVASVTSDGFSVTFPNGSAQVKLAPDARISKVADGTPGDIKAGVTLFAQVDNGVARSVQLR